MDGIRSYPLRRNTEDEAERRHCFGKVKIQQGLASSTVVRNSVSVKKQKKTLISFVFS